MVKLVVFVTLVLGSLAGCSLLDWSSLEAGPARTSLVDADASDGAIAVEGGVVVVDAGARCNPAAPFSAPVLVPGAVNTANDNEIDGFLTPDERTLYFARDHGDGETFDIFVATRTDPDAPFATASAVPGLSSTALAETTPFLDRNGTMYLTIADSSGRGKIASARPDGSGGFQTPVVIAALGAVSAGIADPFFLANGTTFYFSDAYDEIPMTAKAESGSFTTPVRIAGIPVPSSAPKATDDDLTLFFGASPGAGEETDIFVAHRASPTSSFGDVTRVVELSTPDRDGLAWVSGDGCHVVVSRRGNSGDLYFAARGR